MVGVVPRRRSVVRLYVVVGRACDIGRLEGLGIQARILSFWLHDEPCSLSLVLPQPLSRLWRSEFYAHLFTTLSLLTIVLWLDCV